MNGRTKRHRSIKSRRNIKNHKRNNSLSGLICGLTLAPCVAWGQIGSIRVDVTDANTGRAIEDAQIMVTSRFGLSQKSEANASGTAYVNDVNTGIYELVIAKAGYLSVGFSEIRVTDNKTAAIQVKLTRNRDNVIEEVVVQGRATDVNVLGSAGASFLDRESLRSASGSGGDILRALDGMPGLFSNGEFASFTVRGSGPRDNMILVDGIPFDKLVHFSESFGEQEEIEGGGRYSVFAPNLIAGAEFQPGGWGPAYGGRAGSLLSLEVAEGNPETANYTTRLDLAGIEVGYQGPSHLHSGTRILLSARQLDFGRLFEFIGLNDQGSPKLTDIILKTSTDIDSNNSLDFLTVYAPEEYQRDIDHVLASDEDDPGNYEDTELADSQTDNSLFGLTWTSLMGDDAQWVNQLYYRNFDEQGSSGEAFPDLMPLGTSANEIPVRQGIITSKQTETELGWRSDLSVYNRLGRFSSGARVTQTDNSLSLALDDDWIRYVYSHNDPRPSEEQNYIVLTPEGFNTRYDNKSTSYALYIDQTFEYNFWDFRIGSRYDHDGLADENLVSPRFGVNWQVAPRTRLSATAGVYYQSPTLEDRARDANNHLLQNEQINQFSLGVRHQFANALEFMFETYYQDMDNLVVDVDSVNQTLANTGTGRSYGFDTGLTRRFANGWSADISYSYNDAQVRDAKGLDFYDANFNRPHSFGLGGIWEINDRWKLSARWKYASGTPRDEFIVHDNVLGDGQPVRYSQESITTNTDRFAHYSSLNFRADYRRSFGNTDIIAFIDVINLLGAENPTSTEFNERTGLSLPEEGQTIPLLGLRFEW